MIPSTALILVWHVILIKKSICFNLCYYGHCWGKSNYNIDNGNLPFIELSTKTDVPAVPKKTGLNFDFLWKYFVGLNSLWDTFTIIINRNALFCILEQKLSEFVEWKLWILFEIILFYFEKCANIFSVKKKEGMEQSLLKEGVTTIIGSSGNSHLPVQGKNKIIQ